MGEIYILLPLLCLIAGTAQADLQCQNGGFPNGTICNCPNFWGGGNCSKIECLNGGYSNVLLDPSVQPERCVCPSGYIGIHCEAVGTMTPPQKFFPNKNSIETSFNLVFVNLLSNYWGGVAYTQFQTALTNHFSKSNYTQYNLLTNNGSWPVLSDDPALAFELFDFLQDNNLTLPVFTTPGQYNCYPVDYLEEILEQLILKQGLRETAITIFTQHPPKDNPAVLTKVLELAISFDIRINVIWSADSTFVRCGDSDTEVLKMLAEKTGGLFVTLRNEGDYTTNSTIMDTILATHYQYEPLAMTASSNGSTSITFYMNLPATKSYYVVFFGADNSTTVVQTNCPAFYNSVKQTSADGIWSYTISGYMGPTCTLSVGTNGTTRVQVFGNNFVNGGPISAGLFKSYVEDPAIDTSNIQPNQGNSLYFALHVEGNNGFAATLQSATFYQGDISTDLNMTRRDATMEYISNEAIKCDTALAPAWIELSLLGSLGLPEKRYVLVNCQTANSSYLPADYSYIEPDEEDNSPAETTTPSITPKSFILAYSNLALSGIHSAFVLAAVPPPDSGPYSPYKFSFGEILFDSKDSNVSKYFGSQEDYTDFNTAVQTVNYYNVTARISDPSIKSQILEALLIIQGNIGDSGPFRQNSIVAVNVGRLPKDDTTLPTLDQFYPFVMNNVKVVFFIGNSTLNVDPTIYPANIGILNQIAAITSGHVIAYDDTETEGLSSLVTSVLSSGPGQNLLLAKNIPSGNPGAMTPGVIDLSHVKENMTVFVTLTTEVFANATTSLVALPTVDLHFANSSGIIVITTTISRQGTSNYYVANVTLPGNMIYTLSTSNILSFNAKTIRVWTQYSPENPVDVQVSYYDLKNQPLDRKTPDTNQGASLVTQLEGDVNATKLSLLLTDCTGDPIKLYDSEQQGVAITSGFTHFVPFFCTVQNNKGCSPGTEKLYSAQLTSNGGYISTKSFICDDGAGPKPECNHTDAHGNYICGGSEQPYTRGPSGELIDCSGSPLLFYDPANLNYAPFSCNCSGQGLSCADAKCDAPNTAGGVVDMVFRTYTVILGLDTINSASSIAKHTTGMLAPDTQNPSNIWLYQLISYCVTGEKSILYLGTNYTQFVASFKLTNGSICTVNTNSSFDLNQMFETSIKAVGRQQRGLVVFYTELSGRDPYKIIVNKERFIETAQQYRQELYVFDLYYNSPVNVSLDLIEAIMSTGGTFIPSDYDIYDPDVNRKILTDFFSQILTVSSSFNGHSVKGKTIDVNIDSSKKTYLLVGSTVPITGANALWNGICNETNDGTDKTPGTMMSLYGGVCSIKSLNTINIGIDVWYTVVVREDTEFVQVPRAVIIQSRTDDKQTSVAVDYSTGGPTLAIYSGGYTNLTNEDGDARSATRSCTYDRTTVNAFSPLPAGYQNIKVDMTIDSTKVTKVFPFGVSSTINCMNNGEINKGYGQCVDTKQQWEGPDNSRPICQFGGKVSTWGTACNCQGTGYGGRFCDTALLQPPTTPAVSTTQPASTPSSTPAESAEASG